MVEINRNKEKEFIEKVKKRAGWNVEGNIHEVWKKIATCVKNTAKEVIGETKSSKQGNMVVG